MKRIVLAILLAVVLTVSLLTVGAAAGKSVSYVDAENNQLTFSDATEVTASDAEWTGGWYVAEGSIDLENRVTVSGSVSLILADGCTLNATRGISVTSGNSLTIYGQREGSGELRAEAFQVGDSAGIGGNTGNDAAHGNITINGGTIEATSYGGAGIGSGSGSGASDKPNGTITINGGSVTATAGGSNGAGIGGGFFNNITGGDIKITGGTVEAKGGVQAAGIGSGYNDQRTTNGRSITISGGKVTANGGDDAAGIGGGYAVDGKSISSITINGTANVTANGGAAGAGIGGGRDGEMTTNINIGGSAVVVATGGDDDGYGGAGIGTGGGTSSKIGNININGGTVTATGGTSDDYSGAGIGSGGYSKLRDENYKPIPATGKIIINAGTITATGGTGAAGIGDGKYGAGGDFSTGENGQAVIYASSISDNDADGWNGIVFQGDEGQVYGDVTLSDDLTLTGGQNLTVPDGSSLTVPENVNLNAGSGLTNNGTLMILGGISGDISGEGDVVRGTLNENSVASFTDTNNTTLYYDTLTGAINAANSAMGGGTVTLLKDATLDTALDEDVTLSVSENATLTVQTEGLTNLAKGTFEVKAGGGLVLGSDKLVGGTSDTINLTKGSVTMQGNTVTLTSGSEATIPANKTLVLKLGTNALDAVIEQGAKLTVAKEGTLKATSGSGETGSQVTVNGTLDVQGTLTIALKADVTVADGGTLNLPVMTKATMGSDTAGQGMKGDIIVNAGAKLTYAAADVLGGDNPLLTLSTGTATLNLGNANAEANASVSLTLDGKASVASDLKALWVTADGMNTFVPMAITVASGSEATVPAGKVLNLVNGSSLTVADGATFTVAEDGIMEVHSTAKFGDKATVSGKVYVFEANEGTNPMNGASITLTGTGAVYAEKTELEGTNIAPARMTKSVETYKSISADNPTTFKNEWTLSYRVTLNPTDGTLGDLTAVLWTDSNGSLTLPTATPTWTGHTFSGWDSDGNGTVDFQPGDTIKNISEDLELKAVWDVIICTVSFDSDGGSAVATKYVEHGSNVTEPADPTKANYTFVGWYNGVTLYNFDTPVTSDITLKAVWKLNEYTVSFNTAGGSTVAPMIVEHGQTINLPTAPSKPGYIFLGWRNGNVTYGAGDPVVVTSNMTFYAVWANMPDVTPGTPGGGDDEPVAVFPFDDVSVLDWFYDSVYYVWESELMNGTDVNQFSPNSPLTRAMVWAVLARVDGETISGDSWMTEAQAWAVESGVSDGTNPTGYVTREQLVTMLYRFAGEPAGAADISGYPDAASISDWAADAMAWAVKVGLIEGDDVGALNPTANSTRAHAATFFMRFSKTIL